MDATATDETSGKDAKNKKNRLYFEIKNKRKSTALL